MLIGIFIVCLVLLLISSLIGNKASGSYAWDNLFIVCVVFGVVSFFGILGTGIGFFVLLDEYNDIRSTVDEKISVCEQGKSDVLAELDSVIMSYTGYESDFYREYKLNPEKAAFSLYPQLKGDSLYESRMKAVQSYNEEMDL